MPFRAKESPFLAFQIKQKNQNKEKNDISNFLKFLHDFYSVFSIRCKTCKICRSLTLRQNVSVLMTAVFERLHAFHCLICQSWTWGNHLFSDSKKTIPWNVMTENTMEKLIKVNPLWSNAKLQMQVGLNAAIWLIFQWVKTQNHLY